MRKNIYAFPGTRRAVCLLLALLLMGALLLPAAAADPAKPTTKRAISIVFDNSGSMYGSSSDWCRATYSMEVFAAMMNDGDVLEIYPMWPVETGGKTYSSDDPLTVKSLSDVQLIRGMYTPRAGGTPIETIDAAYQGLLRYSGYEQWLIVATDGTEFHENNAGLGSSTKKKLSDRLSEYNESMNVLYLGIGAQAVEPTISGRYQHRAVIAANSKNVLTELTSMCNMIFGRDALPGSGQELEFDLPMNKLIVFIQGQDVSTVSLSAKSGSVGRELSRYAPHYSERGSSNGSVADKSLQGVIVTYTDFPAGSYTLNCDGSPSSIGVYYEPNVDLFAMLVDEYGVPVQDEAYAGTYYIVYGMKDGNGNVTNSKLLGSTEYEITAILNGTQQTTTATEAGKVEIQLAAGDTLDLQAAVTYLSGYHIEKNGAELGWKQGGYRIEAHPAGALTLSADDHQDSYKLSQLEEAEHYELFLNYEGLPLAGGALNDAALDVRVEGASGSGGIRCEVTQAQDGYRVLLRYQGSALDTEPGDYTLVATASYTNEDGQTAQSNELRLPFTVEDDAYGLSMKLKADQKRYVISQLENGKPLRAELTKDGAPLTDEELQNVHIRAQAEGLELEVTPLYGESAVELRIVSDRKYEPGKYKILCAADATDPVGHPISAEDSESITLRKLPMWVIWLGIFLVLLLLILAIIAYLNAKILPSRISISGGKASSFTVSGSRVTGNATCNYSGKNKRTGSLTVNIPRYSAAPMVRGGITLQLEAVSPRKTKSSQRRAGVTGFSVSNGNAVQSFRIGTATFHKDSNGKFVKNGARQTANVGGKGKGKKKSGSNILFEIANNHNLVISGQTVDGTSFNYSGRLEFR